MATRIVKEISGLSHPIFHYHPMKVCAYYVRVSTSHDGQLNSLQNQTEYYQYKFEINPHYEFVGIFTDAGISGSKENRPGVTVNQKPAIYGKWNPATFT